MLGTLGPAAQNEVAHLRWCESVIALRRAIGWAEASPVIRRHAAGTLLAIAAPADQLFTATEVNEWAWEQASCIFERGGETADPTFDQLHCLGNDFAEIVSAFAARADVEKSAALTELRVAAEQHDVPLFADDEIVSLGAGAGSRTWLLTALPDAGSVPWQELHDIPVALVTGSNGKTTTVRLLAALLNASDRKCHDRVGYSSTEGVVIGGEQAGDGDFSGPAGARLVLRDSRVAAAVLETARGGILRRGLAVERADVAVVTNISADHFGEYGIDTLEDLADVKLVVAHALGTEGTLVLNADDPVLLARVAMQVCRIALFAFDNAHPALEALRQLGGSTCGMVDDELWLTQRDTRMSLGKLHEMPLTLNCAAMYNVANISAAALAATAMGVSGEVIAGRLKQFGSQRKDNPGRLERWALADITVLVDYAHNPQGIAGLLVGTHSIQLDQIRRGGAEGRVGLLLGQAGNRRNDAIDELARTAAACKPDLIVLKEITSMLRGRALGEIPALLKGGLLAAGYPAEKIQHEPDEVPAALELLRWARPGDVVVLPIHQSAARQELSALLDELENIHWRAGSPLP